MNKALRLLKKLVVFTVVLSGAAIVYLYFKRNDLRGLADFSNYSENEPVQTSINLSEFKKEKDGVTYSILPLYEYEIWGLVVAQHDSESWLDRAHENDPLNTKDFCVVWGDNISSGVFEQMKYSHGEWTCYAEFKKGIDSSWYDKFNTYSLENNHVLPSTDEIYEKMKNATVGDQIYIKGYLVNYSIGEEYNSHFARKTSFQRGDSKCEIIYVNDFEVLHKGEIVYREYLKIAVYVFLGAIAILLLGFVISVLKPYKELT